MKHRYLDQPWPLRAVALALLCAGYFVIYRPGEDEQQALLAATADSVARTQIAQDAIAHAGAYEASAHAIERELGTVRMTGDENVSMATLLVDLDDAARKRQVDFVGLEPQRTATSPRGLAMLIHARGRYGDVLHYCSDLALLHDLLELDSVDVARDAKTVTASSVPLLDATLHVTLLKQPDIAPQPGGST